MRAKLYTSYYALARFLPKDEFRLVSISSDGGRIARFSGDVYKKLAPKQEFWKNWHDNIGKIPEMVNNKYYIKNYYEQVLKNLDPNEVIKELGENAVLLCYEKPTDFCHRHIVAEWLKLKSIEVDEINYKNNTLNIVERPTYIAKFLKEVMNK